MGGGTATVPPVTGKGPQIKQTLPELMQEARESLPSFTALGNDLTAQMRSAHPALASINFEAGPLKTESRAIDKLPDYDGDASQISDLVRGRIVADNPEQLALIKQELTKMTADGRLSVVKSKDSFIKPSESGYRDMNYKIRLPNGHVAEIQVVDRQMLAAAKLTHDPYEEAQTIKRNAVDADGNPRRMTAEERQNYNDRIEYCRQVHGEAADKAGLNGMLREDLRNDPRFIRTAPPAAAASPPETARAPPPLETQVTGATPVVAAEQGAAKNTDKIVTAAADGLAEGGGTSVLRTVAKVAGKAAVPLTIAVGAGEAGYDVYKGDYKGAAKTATGTAAALAVGEAGALAGMAVGGVVGGVVGGIAGGIAGYYGGSELADKAYDVVKNGAIGARGELSKVYNWFSGGHDASAASAPAPDVNKASAGNKIPARP
jgi:hypothetical protein